MTSEQPPDTATEEFWRDFLTHGSPMERSVRRFFRRIPSDPRCEMCAAPFEGPGAPVMRLIGKRRSDKTPKWCLSCFTFMSRHHGGAEVACTLLFADIRGSTSLAEQMSSGQFRALLDRFYDAAAAVVFDHDGGIDKFVGDELVAMFFPALAGEWHAKRAVDAARALLLKTGHDDPGGPWVPVGAGVHTGPTWIGAVGEGTHTQMTAVGDTVNTTARLASVAVAGEILVSAAAAAAAGLDPAFERRTLELKGKQQAFEVVSVQVGSSVAVAR